MRKIIKYYGLWTLFIISILIIRDKIKSTKMKIFIATLLALALLSSLCDAQSRSDTIAAHNTKFIVTDSVWRHKEWFYKCIDLNTGRYAWLMGKDIKK